MKNVFALRIRIGRLGTRKNNIARSSRRTLTGWYSYNNDMCGCKSEQIP